MSDMYDPNQANEHGAHQGPESSGQSAGGTGHPGASEPGTNPVGGGGEAAGAGWGAAPSPGVPAGGTPDGSQLAVPPPPGTSGDPRHAGDARYPGNAGYPGDAGAAGNQWYYRQNPPWDGGPAGGWEQSRAAGAHWGQQPPNPTQQWPWAPPPAPPKARFRHHGRVTATVAGVAVVVGAAAGLGIGHATWTTNSPSVPAAASLPTGSGSTGSGSTGSGSTGSGSPGSGISGNGSGSGSGSQGSSGFGGSGSSGGFGSGGFGGSGSGSTGSGSTGSGSVSTSPGGPSDVSAIATKVIPGLVDINLTLGYQSEQAAGTGMVLTSSGEVLTNNHVIDGATQISVTDLANSKTYAAKVVGYDSTHDVAVLQLTGASGLQTVSIGDSSKAAVGQAVVGIGNAGGSGGTPSAAGGVITALNQSITASDSGSGTSEQLTGLVGTNANIEAGDSGGPLVNTSGEVIGMDTAGSSSNNSAFNSTTGTTQTVGFAIPINDALSIVKQITSGNGTSTVHVGDTSFLGIGVEPASQAQGGSGFGSGGFGSNGSGTSGNGTGTDSGAVIAQVIAGSAASQAGLVTGDVITALDGQSIASPNDLSHLLVPHHPGDKVQLTWTDQSGQSHTASVKLASGPPA